MNKRSRPIPAGVDPIAELRRKVDASTQAAVAKECGVTPAYLSDVLKGRRGIGPTLLRALGIEQICSYRRIRQ